jgi:hypothetical protein
VKTSLVMCVGLIGTSKIADLDFASWDLFTQHQTDRLALPVAFGVTSPLAMRARPPAASGGLAASGAVCSARGKTGFEDPAGP